MSNKRKNRNAQKNSIIEMFRDCADNMIEMNPSQDYDSSPAMEQFAELLSEQFSPGGRTMADKLMVLRDKRDNRFGVEISTNLAHAFTSDVGAQLRINGVVQRERVASGLLDLVIGLVAIEIGLITKVA